MSFSYDTNNSSFYDESVKLNCKIKDNLQNDSYFYNKEQNDYSVNDSKTFMRCFIDPVLEQKLRTDHLSLQYRCAINKPPVKDYSDCLGYECNKDQHNQFAYHLDEFNTYHTFVVQTKYRDELKEYLSKNEIDTAIHYPVPIHLQPAAKKLGYKVGDFPVTEKQSKEILTLPINQYLEKNDLERIISVVNQFQNKV